MKKSLSIFLMMFFILGNIRAQTISYKIAEGEKGNSIYDYCIRSNNGYILLKTETSHAFMSTHLSIATTLLKVDNDLNTIQELPFVVANADYISIESMQKIKGHTYLFYTKRQKKDDEVSFCSLLINEEDLSKSEEFVISTFTAENDKIAFTVKPSVDSTNFLLFVEPKVKKTEDATFYFAVVNPEMKIAWERNFNLNVESKFIDISSFAANSDKNVFVSYKHFDKEVKKESLKDDDGDRIPAYSTKILSFTPESEKPTTLRLNMHDKFVHSCDINYDYAHKKLLIMGMYKNKFNGQISGTYYSELNPVDNELNQIKTTAFPDELLELVKKDGFASTKSSDPGLKLPYTVANVIFREDGSIDYLLEYQLLKIVTTSNGRTTTTYYEYIYGTIVDAHFKDGQASFVRIPKYQVEINKPDLLSFYPVLSNNKLILLYNDDKDNAEKDIAKSPDKIKAFKSAVLMAATIDANSNLTRDIIVNAKESDGYATMVPVMQRIDNKSVVFTQKLLKLFSTKTRFGTLEIK